MKLNRLSVKDKKFFGEFLDYAGGELSAYAFENIYIWKSLFDIYWAEIGGSLCVFFQDKTSRFMYLPPLTRKAEPEVIEKSFTVMDSFNKNKEISRIENVEEKDVSFYRDIGYRCKKIDCEFLCRRAELAELKGDKFKSKRAAVNYFVKHYWFECLPFSLEYKNECLKLYEKWAKDRRAKNTDYIYRGMIDDNYLCLKAALDNYGDLELEGKIVRVGGKLKGFTLGFRLSDDTFCVLYEITDLSIKGISQFIFKKFCEDLNGYKYINIMGDSGLANLKKVKLSYHPAKLLPIYTISTS